MISAPMLRPCRSAKAWSTPVLPPGSPTIERHHRVVNIHSCRSLPGVPERGVEREAVAGAEPVERDREAVNPDARHGSSFGCDVRPQMAGRAVSRATGPRLSVQPPL